jgi:oxalate decarboxylase/phosphoglucose isomerase-like protein (cupin superfamily)
MSQTNKPNRDITPFRYLLSGLFLFAIALTVSLPAAAQSPQDLDSIKADPQHHNVVLENDQVRVVHYLIPAGEKTAKHSHPDGVIVFFTDAHYKNTTADGKITELQAKAGTPAWRPALTHVVENIGDKPLEGILVEPKQPHSARPAGSADVTTLPNGGKIAKVVFENEKVRVLHYHFESGQMDEMHGHPDSVQIVLMDTKSEVTTPDGKTTTVEAKAGQVVWRPALQHSVRNAGDKPFEGVLVEMKGAPAAASK